MNVVCSCIIRIVNKCVLVGTWVPTPLAVRKGLFLRVPSPAPGALLARLIVPALCTGILALPGACDRLAAA